MGVRGTGKMDAWGSVRHGDAHHMKITVVYGNRFTRIKKTLKTESQNFLDPGLRKP